MSTRHGSSQAPACRRWRVDWTGTRRANLSTLARGDLACALVEWLARGRAVGEDRALHIAH